MNTSENKMLTVNLTVNLDMKDAYKVILSLLLDMIKHSQSTQGNKFANIFTISKKRRYEGSSFFACS